MAFSYTNSKGGKYFLHSRKTTLRNGREQNIYFFAREEKDGVMDAVPEGYEVSETANGLPVLKRSGGPSSSKSKSSAGTKGSR